MPATITAEDIKEIRGSYGLSQRSFALLLGIGPASIVRYEQGAKPTKANANLIRAARNPQFMRDCLEADGDLIPNSQRKKAESVVYKFISADPEENARLHEGLDAVGLEPTMSMNEAYHYTLQQEILNEQAANLIGQLIALKVHSGYPSGQADAMEALLTQLSTLKPTIVSIETRNDVSLAEIRGILNCAAAVLARATADVVEVTR